MTEEARQALPQFEPWRIVSGPDNAIWDDIFDWIANAIRSITRSVGTWADWLWSNIRSMITTRITWLDNQVRSWVYWIRDQVWSRLEWLGNRITGIPDLIRTGIRGVVSSVSGVISSSIDQVWTWITWLKDQIVPVVTQVSQVVAGMADVVYSRIHSFLSSQISWLVSQVTSRIDQVIEQLGKMVPSWLLEPGKWIQELLGGAAEWLLEDIPGHSPRWTGIFESIGGWLKKWFYDFPLWFAEDVPERVAYGLSESFKWISDTIEPIIGTFNETILSFAQSVGPMSPASAAGNFNNLAKVGFTAIAGLTGMTVAGELLHPLKRIGLGNIAAMVWDMTNYKMITGAFLGALTFSMLRQPLTYYFNNIFRPYVLQPRDFFMLMSRDAFTDPEKLREPRLTEAIAQAAGGDGANFEREMIGWYGYPASYMGFFKELANERMGYFALAGIARAGFWDEPWFLEALSRTGYSETAKTALMKMYRELVMASRQTPVLGLARKMYREGFYTREEVDGVLQEAIKYENLQEIRLYAMDIEKDLEERSTALDISLRAFSRGAITEAECRRNLGNLLRSATAIDNNILREKLGLIRRISWTPPAVTTVQEYIEE